MLSALLFIVLRLCRPTSRIHSWASNKSDEYYYAAEKEEARTTAAQLHAKEELARFNMVTFEYKKDLKQQQKTSRLLDDNQFIIKSELLDIVEE
jgi:hypothetical protein